MIRQLRESIPPCPCLGTSLLFRLPTRVRQFARAKRTTLALASCLNVTGHSGFPVTFWISQALMKKVECWRWRYRDPQLGCIRCTTAALTEQEAVAYPESERIDGTLCMREIDESSVESATISAAMGLTRSRPRNSTPVNTCRAARAEQR